jgi:hypothetical protein
VSTANAELCPTCGQLFRAARVRVKFLVDWPGYRRGQVAEFPDYRAEVFCNEGIAARYWPNKPRAAVMGPRRNAMRHPPTRYGGT